MHRLYGTLAVLALAAAPVRCIADCKLVKFLELPVTMTGMQPLVAAKINGADAVFMADSGAFYSMITPAGAAQYGLRLHPAPYNLTLEGVGGRTEAQVAYVDELSLGGHVVRHIEFLVAGSETGGTTVGLLGRNVLGTHDAEYDLANGVIRLMKPGDGCRKAPLAYWAGEQPYSVIDTAWETGPAPEISASGYLNGKRIRVIFDTGAGSSFLTRRAAERAGFAPDAQGVIPGGFGHGIGSHNYRTWIATFPTFKLGDEEVHNARLRVGDADLPHGDMLLGADFFLSHHVYVANGQDKLYFTYNGGPVFDLRRLGSGAAARDPPTDADEGAEPGDAAGFGRRGAAYAARRDFEHAIADFTKASELDPADGSYLRERGLARWRSGRPELALADLDAALRVKPDDVEALVSRAKLNLGRLDRTAAGTDLDTAARLAPGAGDVRLQIASVYVEADRLADAVAQYDLWIAAHPDDASVARAKNGRCWARALMGSDLDKALADCNDAVKMIGQSAQILDSRGLVLLRLGRYDKSIVDYDAALHLDPKSAWSLYGRGVDRLRKGMAADGQSDIAAAVAIRPSIAEEAEKHGIRP